MSRVLSKEDLRDLVRALNARAGPEVFQEFARVWAALQPKNRSAKRRLDEGRKARAIHEAAFAAAAYFNEAASTCPPGAGFAVFKGRALIETLPDQPQTDTTLQAALMLQSAGELLISAAIHHEPPSKWERWDSGALELEAAMRVGQAEGLLMAVAAKSRDTSGTKRRRSAPQRSAAREKATASPSAASKGGAVVARLAGVSERTARRALADMKSRP